MPLREKVPTTEDHVEASVPKATSTHGDEPAVPRSATGQHDGNGDLPPNDLSMIQAATLLTADCLGVGILALPKDVQELGWIVGLGFLLANLPINYYAGKILAVTAEHVEAGGDNNSKDGVVLRKIRSEFEMVATSDAPTPENEAGTLTGPAKQADKKNSNAQNASLRERASISQQHIGDTNVKGLHDAVIEESETNRTERDNQYNHHHHHHHQNDAEDGLRRDYRDELIISTHDFIGMTTALYKGRLATQLVMALYFVNIFLVLGDYILVMSYAVDALLGDNICLPWAGVLASILMFALAQLRTMSRLGREASLISLACLFVVLVQCLVAAREDNGEPPATARTSVVGDSPLLRKFSALASIGFAMGSQKLFLNIRHEMRHKEESPHMLLGALGAYGTAYVAVVVLAGTDPPSFLFEAIPEGISRRTAGFLLWLHVSVSYAINSQAICSSLDRLLPFWSDRPIQKWMVLTGAMAFTSYTVANAVPFFQDLVSLIGALTSVPLALTLPAIFYRYAIQQVSMWAPAVGSSASYSLLMYSMVFLMVGLVGALYSIDRDWANQGKAFSCY